MTSLKALPRKRRFIKFSERDYQVEKYGKTLKIQTFPNKYDSIILYHF